VTHPYPGAFCAFGGRKLLVWESRIASEAGRHGAPGEIVSTGESGAVEVAAGEGALWIARAQFEGAPEDAAAEVLSGVLAQVSPEGLGEDSRTGGYRTCARLE
jgi:methionyl-tRNA formyltransferase